MQRPGLSFTPENLWQLRDRKEEPIRGEKPPSGELCLGLSLFGPWILTKETVPDRHSGHAIEPGGPFATAVELFMVQRYSAQRMQNS